MISNYKEASVKEMMEVTKIFLELWFILEENFFVWEGRLLDNMIEVLEGFNCTQQMNYWKWIPKENGMFSVSSAYTLLEKSLVSEDKWSDIEKRVYSYIWKGKAPSRVIAFSWKLLLRISTKHNLLICNVLSLEISVSCVFCESERKNDSHIFFVYDVTSRVWRFGMCWLEFMFIMSPNLFVHFECWTGIVTNEKLRNSYWIIWKATI